MGEPGSPTPPFDLAMQRLGPWEPHPGIALAVSGGSDSMALALLMRRWGRARLLGLVVDHRLRPEAAQEAAQASAWLAALDIPAHVLRWDGAPPAASQAAARIARYRLLAEAAAGAGMLHLATGHHADDLAETRAMRAARDPAAAAGMPASRSLGPVRLIRPLLGMAKADLQAICQAAGQPWIDDPSNRNLRYERVRLRGNLPPLPAEPAPLPLAPWLAEAAEQLPGGAMFLDPHAVAEAAPALLAEALRRLLAALRLRDTPIDRPAAQALAAAMQDGSAAPGRTLAGFRIARYRRGWLLSRAAPRAGESRALSVSPGQTRLLWDARLAVALPPGLAQPGDRLDRLGPALAARQPGLSALGSAVRAELPGLFRGDALIAAAGHELEAARLHCTPAGRWAAAPAPFRLV